MAALHSLRMRMFIGAPAILAVIAAAFWVMVKFGVDDGLFEITFFVLVAIGVWMYEHVLLYHDDIKLKIFPTVFQHFGDFTYTPEASFTIGDWQETGIIPTLSSSKFEDKVTGHYRDVPLEIVEAILTKGSGKNAQTVFKGLIAAITLPKRFIGTTVIHRDKGKLGNWMTSRRFEPVRLENPHFERRYEVCSTNQIEARYLLSITFMERLIELEDKLDSTIEAAFDQGNC